MRILIMSIAARSSAASEESDFPAAPAAAKNTRPNRRAALIAGLLLAGGAALGVLGDRLVFSHYSPLRLLARVKIMMKLLSEQSLQSIR